MNKLKFEWNILFSLINSQKAFMFTFIATYFNVLLNYIIAVMNATNGTSNYNLIMANFWMILTILYLVGVFTNKRLPRFVKTVSATKRIFTTRLSNLFEILNTVPLVFVLIYWIRFAYLGRNVQGVSVLFAISCVSHLIFSVLMPVTLAFFQDTEKHAQKTDYAKILKGIGLAVLYLVEFCCIGLLLKNKLFQMDTILASINSIPVTAFLGICSLLVILSCVISWLLFNMVYKRKN